ncbi:hypothetical protein [Homoserinimonas hongtaonis]|uniref:hypothetical protein n=1 Tax=Homoserinimonas hongtaonis TaxID=2079791 RepID=UPI000D395F81|nr:hypothetical protein [Salinibacterium hongtaonis]AWB88379.1 hypothetical protein C2138_01400 [Salinibacterium hongtaonis]
MSSSPRLDLLRTGRRRAAAVAVATVVLAAPLLVAGPAMAVPEFPITAVSFGQSTIDIGERFTAHFNGDTSLTEIDSAGGFICMSEYKNRAELNTTGVSTAQAQADFALLTGDNMAFEEGDEYSVAFHERVTTCDAPAWGDASAVFASITVGALPVVAPPCADCTVAAAPIALKQGVAVDVQVPLQLAGAWDWTSYGWVAAGPQSGNAGVVTPFSGLMFESIESPGVAPQLRIVGTPIYSGSFNAGLVVGNGTNYAEAPLILNIAAAPGNSAVTIGAATGAPIAGAPVNVVMSGLQPGAAFSVTVRSTPVIIGSGTVAIDGVLAQSFTIPAGLEAGRHSVTLSSTLANGSTVTAVLYFTVSATGTLVAVSLSQPALAATGADATPAVVVAGTLLLLGSAFAGAAVYRRRKVAA